MTHPEAIQAKSWNDQLREPRIGAMLHFDASASDESSVEWLASPKIKVSYNYLILDSGNTIPIAPKTARAWHAGVCRSPDPRLVYKDANSAFYGLSLAATVGDVAAEVAKRALVGLLRTLFLQHGWPYAEVWRIVSHREHAWPWPTATAEGRKSDPEGPRPLNDRPWIPVLSTNEIRGMMAVQA